MTGDVGFLDQDGFLTLVDRSKDMLVSGGENIYPAEIENALYGHRSVAECAVFGIPDNRWGEVPAAHVVLSPDASVSEDELIDLCVSKIARFKRPRLIKFVDSLPKTPVGKIRKSELRDPYWAGQEKRSDHAIAVGHGTLSARTNSYRECSTAARVRLRFDSARVGTVFLGHKSAEPSMSLGRLAIVSELCIM